MPFKKKYSDEELTKAILLILDKNMSPKEVSTQTHIPLRTLQRYKKKYIDDFEGEKHETKPDYPEVFRGNTAVMCTDVQKQRDATLFSRANFLNEVFITKRELLARLREISKNSTNVDAIQKSIKTLDELETKVLPPKDDTPGAHIKNLNVYQVINQQLTQEGYEGPELTDADIVNGVE